MRNVLTVIRRDIRSLLGNVMACVVIFGLVIIPSLFSWFNVIASWEPFDNTNQLSVAVASADAGYTTELLPVDINIGDQVLSALRANDDLDWVVTNRENAIEGTRSGEYYAAIVLPESFSQEMMTFYSASSQRVKIDYYTNEKKNALAPKITGQGAEGVSGKIDDAFTEVLSETALGLITSMSDFLNDADTQVLFARMEAHVGNVAAQLRSGAHTATMFEGLVDSAIPVVEGASELVGSASDAFQETSGALKDGVGSAGDVAGVLRTASGTLTSALAANVAGYDDVAARIDEVFTGASATNRDRVAVINAARQRVQQQLDQYETIRESLVTTIAPLLPDTVADDLAKVTARLDEAITWHRSVLGRLDSAAGDIQRGNESSQKNHRAVKTAVKEAQDSVEAVKASYAQQLKPKLDELAGTIANIRSDVASVRESIAGVSRDLSQSSGSVLSVMTDAKRVAGELSTTFTETADKVDDLEQAFARASDTGNLDELKEIIGSDPGTLATSLAAPIAVERTAVFPVVSFGAGMAPLYAVLALWVGALLMSVAIGVAVEPEPEDAQPLSLNQKYLGRYGIFALLGLAQSTLLTGGLIAFVKIEPAHPLLLLFAGWVISLVFTFIVYTAVVAFGNAGKALCVLLLVIQISASGGAYPLPLLPDWFQNVSPFMPATYAVDALRAAIAGVWAADFWIAIGMLLLFAVPVALLGLVLRRPLIGYNTKLLQALESTKLM